LVRGDEVIFGICTVITMWCRARVNTDKQATHVVTTTCRKTGANIVQPTFPSPYPYTKAKITSREPRLLTTFAMAVPLKVAANRHESGASREQVSGGVLIAISSKENSEC
jgi:hypothetical protein